MLLTRDQILKAEDLPSQDVNVPEWGGTVRVRGMTGEDRDWFEHETLKRDGGEVTQIWTNYRAKVLSRCIVDENNKPVFTEKDIEALGQKSYKALDRVLSVAIDLSGVSKKEADNIKNE